MASWHALGVIALAIVLALALSAVSGVLIPLAVAVILSFVLEPLVEFLKRRGLPLTLAVVLTLLTAVAVAAGTIGIAVGGFFRQWPEIHRQLMAGWSAALRWAESVELDVRFVEHARLALEEHAPQLGQGILAAVTSTFYGALSLFLGVFFALYFLFFTLRDSAKFPAWLSRTTTLDAGEVNEVIARSRQALRGYFKGTATTAILTAPIFMVPLLILGVPLAIPIFVVYFFLSFIPFVGAWATGAFAVLIAFGSGGAADALILGIAFVLSNGAIQSVVNSWTLGSSLRLHPMVVLLATMIGGTLAGVLGMVIGAPAVAAVVQSLAAIRRLRTAPMGAGDPAPPDSR